MKTASCKLAAIAAMLILSNVGLAQTTDTQLYTMTIDPVLTITAPAAATLTHDGTDNDNAFSAQTWTIEANDPDGVSVSFDTGTAFTNGTYKADAKLDLAVNTSSGPGTWTVTTASDQTNHVGSDEVATVAASCDDATSASLDLTVTFVTSDFSIYAAGDYTTTVTGTLTAL